MEEVIDVGGRKKRQKGSTGGSHPSLEGVSTSHHTALPIWVRAPQGGPEFYSGFGRAKLYELAAKGLIRSVSMRESGRSKGVRLFHLGSILELVARCESGAALERIPVQRKGDEIS